MRNTVNWLRRLKTSAQFMKGDQVRGGQLASAILLWPAQRDEVGLTQHLVPLLPTCLGMRHMLRILGTKNGNGLAQPLLRILQEKLIANHNYPFTRLIVSGFSCTGT